MKLAHRQSWSGKGERPEAFRVRLNGIAVDRSHRLLAVGDQEFKRFLPDGTLQMQSGLPEVGWSIAATEDAIWVGLRGAIAELDAKGTLRRRIDDRDRLGRVTAIAVDGATLVAADATHRTIHVYEAGRWQGEIGQDVNTRGFMLPNGTLDLALESGSSETGRTFVVAHPQKHRVERYDLHGRLVDKFGRFGMTAPGDFGGCCNPTNVTALPGNLLALSEKAPPRVKIYTAQGAFLTESAEGVFDANTKNIDLAADRDGLLYASDPYRCTIEVFRLERTREGEAL